jgi:Protein of unknown function (DUF2786)
MTAPDHIITKVRFLLNLGTSSNANEAAAAKSAAEKLIAKYNITEAELKAADDSPRAYSVDSLVYKSFSVVGWMQHLVLACAKQFYCHVVVEQIKASSGHEEYSYYAYGDDADVANTKFAFNAILKKIHELLDTRCIGRGDIYKNSYCEGCVESVKSTIASFGIEIPEKKQATRPIKTEEKVLNNETSNLAVHKSEKEKPEKETINVAQGSKIKDVMAYFRGLEDGSKISVQDVLELAAENEEPDQLEEDTLDIKL